MPAYIIYIMRRRTIVLFEHTHACLYTYIYNACRGESKHILRRLLVYYSKYNILSFCRLLPTASSSGDGRIVHDNLVEDDNSFFLGIVTRVPYLNNSTDKKKK